MDEGPYLGWYNRPLRRDWNCMLANRPSDWVTSWEWRQPGDVSPCAGFFPSPRFDVVCRSDYNVLVGVYPSPLVRLYALL